jgi:hypothetical protein
MGAQPDLREIPPPPEWGVTIDAAAIERLAVRLGDHRFERASYDYEGTPDIHGEEWGRFVVLGVAVVWRLWPPAGEEMWSVPDGGRFLADAPGLWTCFRREPHALDLTWHASGEATPAFFAGAGVLQDVPRRIELMQQVAQSILDRHDGSVVGMVERAGGGAERLRDMIVDTIPGYHDRPMSAAGELHFDKLANLAVTMLAARLPVTGTELFPVFPDYMLPRHLRHEGILVYSPSLAAKVDEGAPLGAGSEEEMAIRWATIRAAESLRRRLAVIGNAVTTPDLDYWLWSEAVLGPQADAMGRHHLCLTEAY